MIIKNLDEMVSQLQKKGFSVEVTMSIVPPQDGVMKRLSDLEEQVARLQNSIIARG